MAIEVFESYRTDRKSDARKQVRLKDWVEVSLRRLSKFAEGWCAQHQFSSVVQLCTTLCNHMDCSTPDFPVHHQLPELAQTHVHPVSDAIQPFHPLPSPSPPAFKLSHQGFSWESVLHIRWPKYQSFSFSICPSNEYSGWISFCIGCFDLLLAQGTPKSLLQLHS